MPNEPIARLTPLGWTCVGKTGMRRATMANTLFAHTYFAKNQAELADIDMTLRQFWELESITSNEKILSPIDRKVLHSTNDKIPSQQLRDGKIQT